MKTQTIKVEGLPEGWKTVSYGWPKKNVDHVFDGIGVKLFIGKEDHAMLIVQKIQLLRIVLEETETTCNYEETQEFKIGNNSIAIWSTKVLREVKETNEEPKLSLNKKDMLELIEHIKLGGQLNPKIAEFIDYEQPEPKLSLSACECKGLFEGNQPAINKVKEFVKENS